MKIGNFETFAAIAKTKPHLITIKVQLRIAIATVGLEYCNRLNMWCLGWHLAILCLVALQSK